MARRRVLPALLCAGLVACSTDSGVTVQRADPIGADATAPSEPSEPPAESEPGSSSESVPTSTDDGSVVTLPTVTLPPSPTTDPGASDDPSPDPTDPPATDPDGVGDELFPTLGNPGIDVQDYDVNLTYDPALDTIEGSVTLTVTLTEDRDEITLDSVGLDVELVAIDGAPADFAVEDVELRITPAAPLADGSTVEIAIDYSGAPDAETSVVGIPNGWFHTDGGSYVLNEPDGARTWVPSNDHPSDKATWTFEVTVPTGLTVVANGSLVSTTPGPDGDTWVWRQAEPMTTYLVQLLTGDYELIEGTGPNGLPLVSAILRDDVKLMQPFVDTIDDQIAFFEQWFGPYPLDRYGISMSDSFPGLAMETQGRSLFSRDDFSSGSLGYLEELLLSHELAHQWFGDAVSPATWGDIWLNESFATYGQWMWMEEAGQADLETDAEFALEGRATGGGRPTGDPAVGDLFGFNSYEGGAVVLHALRLTIGDDAFFGLLRQWVIDNDGTSRTTDDFIALAEEMTKTDLTEFFDTWLFASKLPRSFPS